MFSKQMNIAEIQAEITGENTADEKESKPLSGGYDSPDIVEKSGRFVVTAVQNNTDLHEPFYNALKLFCESTGSELICCPILYNKNAWAQPDDAKDVYFDPAIKGNMFDGRMLINGNVLIAGSAHVLPTASNPISGFGNLCGDGQTVIIPASKIAMECLPVLKGQKSRTLLSTGTVTRKNYINRKVGNTSELLHRYGAVIVEPGKMPRSIYWENDCFFDFDGEVIKAWYEDGGASVSDNRDYDVVLTLGDLHAEKMPADRLNAIAELVHIVQPATLVCHDSLDFSSRNHHHRHDAFAKLAYDVQGDTVGSDIKQCKKMLQMLRKAAGEDCEIVLADSNHDRALLRWLTENTLADDMRNAEDYLRLALAYVKAVKRGEKFNPLAYALRSLKGIQFLDASDSFIRYGTEFAHHGDTCANGARGSLKGFAKLCQGLVIGHSHSPGIQGKAFQVGVSASLAMGYNEKGASGWRHAHCLTFPNGQNQLYFE